LPPAVPSSQPRQTIRLDGKPFTQSTRCDRDMHHMVTTEHATKLCRRKWIENPDPLSGTGEKSRAFRRAAVRRLQDQSSPTSPQPLTRLVEPRDRLAGPSGESQ